MIKVYYYFFMLAFVVGLAKAASFYHYPPISSGPNQQVQDTSHEFNRNGHGRYLFVNSTYTPVINATTIAVTAFYFGSIGLGILSVFNDAANAVARHRAKKLKAKKDSLDRPILEDLEDDFNVHGADEGSSGNLDPELLQYEQQVREYEKAYADYVKSYQDWADKYGQVPQPPAPAERNRRYQSSKLYYLSSCSKTSPTLPDYKGRRGCT
jgi:hypothetical protein